MGFIKVAVVSIAGYTAFRVAVACVQSVAYGLAVFQQTVLGVSRAASVLLNPPGSSSYSGPPTWWILLWNLLTLRPLQFLIAPGSFTRSYALLVAPALAVAFVASMALLVRISAVKELLQELVRYWRGLLSAAACLVSLLLLDDAFRAHACTGRMFIAALRGSMATLLGFCGLVDLLGSPDSGGFSWDQRLEWLRALSMITAGATFGVGGGTLILHSGTIRRDGGCRGSERETAVAAAAAAAASQLPTTTSTSAVLPCQEAAMAQAVDQVSFLLYGSFMLLIAVGFFSRLTESDLLDRLGGTALRLLRLLRLWPILTAPVRVIRWMRELHWLRAAGAMIERADDVLTRLLKRGLRKSAAVLSAAMELLSKLLRSLHRLQDLTWSLMRGLFIGILKPILRSVRLGVRRLVTLVVDCWQVLYCRVLLPFCSAAASAALAACREVLGPLAATVWEWFRRWLVPLIWPAGSAAGAIWFVREMVVQRAVLPFGAAACVAAIIAVLMTGKALRKTRVRTLAALGDALEHTAATAYLHLDLGLGSPAARMLGNAIAIAWLTAMLLAASGRRVLAFLAAPLAGLLAAALTVMAALWRYLGRVVYPCADAAWKSTVGAVATVWSRPEWSLVLAGAVLVVAYVAHAAQLPAVATSLLAGWASAAASATGRHLLWLISPQRRFLIASMSRVAAWLGLSSGAVGRAAAVTAAALMGWGHRSQSDMASLFSSVSFARAFLGLNLLHSLLLKGWVMPALHAQGERGQAAVVPVVSFVARSTGKVALGPMYLTAAASLLAVGHTIGLPTQLASLTTPVLWMLYLTALWMEGVRRVGNTAAGRSLQVVGSSPNRSAWLGRLNLGYWVHVTNLAQPTGRNSHTESGSGSGSGSGSQPVPNQQVPPTVRTASAPPSITRAAFVTPSPAGAVRFASASAVAAASSRVASSPPAGLQQPSGAGLPALTSLEQRLYDQIIEQSSQRFSFPTEACVVCCEKMEIPEACRPLGQQRGVHQRRISEKHQEGGREEEEEEGSGGFAPLLALRCGHVFHQHCVLQWLMRTPRCPLCREPALGALRHTNMLF